jgi:hypothetical protein
MLPASDKNAPSIWRGFMFIRDYASSEFWVLCSEKRPLGWLESKVESRK